MHAPLAEDLHLRRRNSVNVAALATSNTARRPMSPAPGSNETHPDSWPKQPWQQPRRNSAFASAADIKRAAAAARADIEKAPAASSNTNRLAVPEAFPNEAASSPASSELLRRRLSLQRQQSLDHVEDAEEAAASKPTRRAPSSAPPPPPSPAASLAAASGGSRDSQEQDQVCIRCARSLNDLPVEAAGSEKPVSTTQDVGTNTDFAEASSGVSSDASAQEHAKREDKRHVVVTDV